MSLLNQIKILYEDENLLVINKPAGLVVHSDGKSKEETVSDWVLKNYPQTKGVGEPLYLNQKLKISPTKIFKENLSGQENQNVIHRPGIVHRLDRQTSGVLVIAKNQETFLFLKKEFQSRAVEKTYLAFVYGEIKNDKGKIERPIARSRHDFRQWSAQRGARGKQRDAITEYRVINKTEEVSYLEVKPKTGRTHQIRVHLKAINHPVVCDKLYAPKREPLLGFNRLALHAQKISFRAPQNKFIEIEAPLPSDFKQAIRLISKT